MKARVNTYLNERTHKPSVNAPGNRYYQPGDLIEVVQIVNGDHYEGNKVWYKLDNGAYVWSGGVEGIEEMSSPIYTDRVFKADDFWWIKDYGIAGLWKKGLSGKGVKIAILDTGISYPHPDLNLNSDWFKDVSDSASGIKDINGHGTHCAGIIKASNNGFGITGIAYDADVYVCKIRNDDIGDDFSYLIKGIEWAISRKCDIVSISNGRPVADAKLEAAIEKAALQNILVVCAAGNKTPGYPDDHIYYPARFSKTLSVGGVDESRAPLQDSLLTGETGIFAPGHKIFSTYKDTGYEKLSGSSQATPFIAGVGALLLEYAKNKGKPCKPSDIKDIIINGALSTSFGSIINIEKSLKLLDQ